MAIDIGSAAIDRGSYQDNVNATLIDNQNPANDSGKLTDFEVYAVAGHNVSGLKVGTFSVSGNYATYRDHEDIGNVTAGSKQTFTGKNCDVETDDVIGWLITGGWIEQDIQSQTNISLFELSYNAFSAGTHLLNDNSSGKYKLAHSIYGIGEEAGAGAGLAVKHHYYQKMMR